MVNDPELEVMIDYMVSYTPKGSYAFSNMVFHTQLGVPLRKGEVDAL